MHIFSSRQAEANKRVHFFARAASFRQKVGIFHNFGTGMKSYFSVGLVETKIAIDLLSF